MVKCVGFFFFFSFLNFKYYQVVTFLKIQWKIKEKETFKATIEMMFIKYFQGEIHIAQIYNNLIIYNQNMTDYNQSSPHNLKSSQ